MHTIRPGGWGVYFLFDGRVGSLGGREQAVQAEKKGFRLNWNPTAYPGGTGLKIKKS